MKQIWKYLLTLLPFLVVWAFPAHGDVPSFPGADEDATTPGGRWGRVIFVTNLQDSGEGSLRAAMETAGRRMVLFHVSGVIELKSPITVTAPRMTVAGQSAPGDGIVISGDEVVIDTYDVILRYLTFHREGLREQEDALRLTDQAKDVVTDNLRFVRRLDGDLASVRSVLPAVDSDLDGIPDAWKRRFGFDPDNPRFGVFDANRSGLSNLEEFLSGRDPRSRIDFSDPRQNVNVLDPEVRLADSAEGQTPRLRSAPYYILDPDDFQRHIEYFNSVDTEERVVNKVSNAESWDWLKTRIPFFESSDADLEEIYYFRWWALRKHLKTANGYPAYTEFIELETQAPFVPDHRVIASGVSHHLRNTRWMRDQQFEEGYIDFWLRSNDDRPPDHFHQYSNWFHHTLWERNKVVDDDEFLIERFDDLLADYRAWQEEHQLESGLYWQYDVWDAMEESISGSRTEKNKRPPLNSYMYGNALGMAEIARLAGRPEIAAELKEEARELRELTLHTLWNPASRFFEVVHEDGTFANVREAIGFIPWYFHLPEKNRGYEVAWKQAIDPEGFWAPYGFTTAERRHPLFRSHNIGTCEWDGAVWPFATSQTLEAMGNVLRDYGDVPVTVKDWFDAFIIYTRSHRFYDNIPYIGEYQDEVTGYWLKGKDPRAYFYNHSTYADLLITNLVGLRPRADNVLEVNPLLPEGEWAWFALDGVRYRGHDVTILWDRLGDRYGFGPGFHVLVDGELFMQADSLQRLKGELP
ncbi:MAG: hypothetical protein JJU00_00085 [Opitutales bacterium]|nr:hypothetical protein [Opitutales bacterium]